MTKEEREEAIAIIRKEYLCVDRDCDIERNCGKCNLMMPSKEPILKAYKMAISALSQPQIAEEGTYITEGAFKQVMWERDTAIKQLNDLGYEFGEKIEPQGDTISRQAAIERIDEYIEEYNYVDADGNHEPKWCAMMEAKMVLEELPSSQPDIEAMLSEIEEARELWNYDTMEHEIYTECLEVIDKYSHSKPQPDIEAILKEIDEYKHRKLSMGIGIEDLEKGKQIALDYVMAIIDKHIQKPQERSE